MKPALLALCIIFLPFLIFSQQKKTFNQVAEISKSIKTIEIDLDIKPEFKEWDGDFLLIETSVELYNGTKNLFDTFIRNDRYIVGVEPTGDQLNLDYNDRIGEPIKLKGNMIDEVLYVKIYYPKFVSIKSENCLAVNANSQ